jgi:hypothetical protein
LRKGRRPDQQQETDQPVLHAVFSQRCLLRIRF